MENDYFWQLQSDLREKNSTLISTHFCKIEWNAKKVDIQKDMIYMNAQDGVKSLCNESFQNRIHAQHMREVSSHGSNIPLKILYGFIHEYFK